MPAALNVKALSRLVTDIRTKVGARLRRSRYVSPPPTAAERRRRYEQDGFVAGGPLLASHEVDELCAEFDRIWNEAQAAANGGADGSAPDSGATAPGAPETFTRRIGDGPPLMYKRFKDGAGGEYYAVYDLHRHSSAFETVVRHPRLVEMVAELTGLDEFRVLLDQIQYKPPATGGWNGWHRDMPSFPFIRPYTALTAWIALDDATRQNGCMQMVPGSHAWGDASDLAGDGWGLPHLPNLYHGHQVRPVMRPVRRGHVHFHHEMTWHCSPPNKTAGKRRALAVLFIGADERYREGGKIVFPELSQGDSMEKVARLVVSARGRSSLQ